MPLYQATAPLSNKQKARLSQLAKQAYDSLCANGADPDEPLDVWRQQQALTACGYRVSEATQRHYKSIEAQLLSLIPSEAPAAFEAHLRSAPETADREQALHLIKRECAERNLPYPAYPNAISRDKYKCLVTSASASQLGQILMSLKKRKSKANNINS